jgi:hypothetical protein
MKTMKQLGIPNTLPPSTRRDLKGYLWFGVIGLLLLTLGILPNLAAVRWGVLVALLCWFALPARGWLRRSPNPHSEGRKSLSTQIMLCTFVVVGFSIGFALWARQLGLAWPIVIGAVFLIDAFANIIASLTEWWRLSMFGHSIGLMILGFGFPFVNKNAWTVLLGGSVLAGSLLATGILYWQIRRHENIV